MLSNEITAIAGANKKCRRLGRGKGTGHGKTSGRGHKGSGSRPGSFARATYEGGQMPLFRRLPKRGFNNFNFAKRYEIVNVSQLEKFFSDGTTISIQELAQAGLVGSVESRVKILGDGELTKKLDVAAHKFSKSAEQKISGCGGSVKVVA
ncbi:MAG: 50S ribosomal protein L15 [Sedimentisphaerales bacterium]|nr:50S ribosomal protein L15 [Sedimentisphaerales bacterium]